MKRFLQFSFFFFAMVVMGFGQVGIGTTNPLQMMHIFKPSGTSAIFLEQTISMPGTYQVTKSAGTGANIAGPGKDWITPENITANDGSRALGDLTNDEFTDPLRGTNFGFSIPAGATITGIKVEILKKAHVYYTIEREEFTDNSVMLVSGGTAQGTDHASLAVWPESYTYVPYGNASDMWGIALTPSIVNSPDFGVQISVALPYDMIEGVNVPDVGDYADVDHIQITVYYTFGSPVSNGWIIGDDYNDGGKFKIASGSDFGTGDVLTISSGNIGIGTTTPDEKLRVAGNVKANAFIATYNSAGAFIYNSNQNMNVPDYVFDQYYRSDFTTNPHYKMLSLDDLEQYISRNGHLPRVPSRSQINSDGAVNIQGLSMINLEKTEENTLYILQLKKQNDELQKQILELRKEVEELRKH